MRGNSARAVARYRMSMLDDLASGNALGAAGKKVKDKLKSTLKAAIKKLVKKLVKQLFKLLLKLLAKAAAALIASFGLPTLLGLVVVFIVGGALIYVSFTFGWLGADSSKTASELSAAYTRAIERTTDLPEYRPPMIVVQAIDNMRLTKEGMVNVTDIDPEAVASALKPDLTYKNFINTTTTVTTTTHETETINEDGTTSTSAYTTSSTSVSHTNFSLLVKAHAWNRLEDILYHQVTTVTNSSSGDSSSVITTTVWERDPEACNFGGSGDTSGGGSPAAAPLTGIGNSTNPFFISYSPGAIEESRKSGIPASVILAQAVQEGGWGNSELTSKYFNFFGIKAQAGDGWTGPTVNMGTSEYQGGWTLIIARFRVYGNAREGFADHSKFLLENGRYKTALSKKNPYEFANELQKASYATDPGYATALKNIMHQYNLLQYDLDGGIDAVTGKPYEDVAYVPGPGSMIVGCGTPDFTKFDALLHKYNFSSDDVMIISEGIKENDPSHSFLAGYNGDFGNALSETPLVGSINGDYVESIPVQAGQMLWPTTAQNLTSGFGMRVNPTNHVLKLHKGIDIAPSNFDYREYPNIAAMDGLVVAAGYTEDGYGFKVIIDHGSGLETLYGHMKAGSLKVSIGQKVKAGTVLGIMGATGDVTARHLHFEVHYNGRPANPIGYVHREAS
ncbi:Flagellum-specific peptidoglycan hydrolase FlgJ [Paenibacillus sp. GP183]|nr:Flagellum-specific peptidoglycan hydrolase FlgJ [Paenibacillus sp. GP183]